MPCWLIWGIWPSASLELAVASSRDKPAPTGTPVFSDSVKCLWERACPAKKPPQYSGNRPFVLDAPPFDLSAVR